MGRRPCRCAGSGPRRRHTLPALRADGPAVDVSRAEVPALSVNSSPGRLRRDCGSTWSRRRPAVMTPGRERKVTAVVKRRGGCGGRLVTRERKRSWFLIARSAMPSPLVGMNVKRTGTGMSRAVA